MGSCTAKSCCPDVLAQNIFKRGPAVLQVSDILDPEAGFVHKEGLSISCEVLEACPW